MTKVREKTKKTLKPKKKVNVHQMILSQGAKGNKSEDDSSSNYEFDETYNINENLTILHKV